MPGKRADGVSLRKFGVNDALWEEAKATTTPDLSVGEVLREALKAWLKHPDARYDLFTPPPPQR